MCEGVESVGEELKGVMGGRGEGVGTDEVVEKE